MYAIRSYYGFAIGDDPQTGGCPPSRVITSYSIHYTKLYDVFFFTSGLFLLLDAQYLAAINVILYGGAIMVLFLFVIMLLNLGHAEWKDLRGPFGGMGGMGGPFGFQTEVRGSDLQYEVTIDLRITSYNVCYTKLLRFCCGSCRPGWASSPCSSARPIHKPREP